MLWLLLAMVALVFFTAWAVLNTFAWAVVLAVVAVAGGAVLGNSTDLD